MKYKLIVLDVDGTLLDGNREIPSSTLATLLLTQQMGIRIVLASGRSTHGLRPIAHKLELDRYKGYIMSYNGGQIISMEDGALVFERRIDPKALPYIAQTAAKSKFPLFTYHLDTLITDNAANTHVREEAERNNMHIVETDDISKYVNFSPCKCIITSDDPDALAAMESKLRKRLNGVLDVFISEPYFLEIVPPLINKADTLGILMGKLSITPEETIAIGNGVCDIGMIQMAGLGIAMENAPETVKRCADYTTFSNEDNGVGKAIEEHIFGKVQVRDLPLNDINKTSQHALMGSLGIKYTYASEGRIEATMPVDVRTRQPFGILHGGATLALAETVAGFGSMLLCKPDETIVGMQVSGNHVSSAREGDTVRAVATIIHCGRSSHLWNVDVYTSTDKLVSTIRVINSVLKKK